MFEEVLFCLRENCEDFNAALCGQSSCDIPITMLRVLEATHRPIARLAQPEWLSANYGSIPMAYVCPRTCGACEGQAMLQPETTPCAPGWSYADGQCYKYDYGDSRQKHEVLLQTWRNAEETCKRQGAHLALVETRAQEELVFQLVRQRPQELGVSGLWAWVGMRTGILGCNGTGSWTWVGAPHSGHGAYMDTRLNCKCWEVWTDLGHGCCSDYGGTTGRHVLFSGILGTFKHCEEKCLTYSDCGYVIHGWGNTHQRLGYCVVISRNATCAQLNRVQNGCGFDGDVRGPDGSTTARRGVHTYKLDTLQDRSCSNFLYTNSEDAGETHVFSRHPSDRIKPKASKRAWICSRPAALLAIKGESCEAAGLLPITDMATCEAAARELLGMRRIVFELDSDVVRYSGCWMRRARYGPRLSRSLGGDSSMRLDWTASPSRTHLCRRPNVSGQATGTTPAPEVADPWQLPVVLMPAADSSPAMIVLFLLLGVLPAMGLPLLAGRRLSRPVWLKCGALLSAARELRARWVAKRKDKFARAIQARLHTWRDAAAGIMALLLIAFHLSKLVQTLFVPGAVCVNGTVPHKRELLAGVELANIWAATAFLLRAGGPLCSGGSGAGRRGGDGGGGDGGSSASRWRHAFVFCTMALGVAEAALLREQSLLVESRLYRDLLLRILTGACASLTPALLGNALVSAATCGLYKAFIPDGMIFTVGTSPTGFSQPGCNTMWDPSVANQIKVGIEGSGRLFSRPLHVVEGVDDLIDDLLSKKTSFSTFLSTELVLLLVISVFLAVLHAFLRQDAARSLKLRSSEEQLTAFSKVLENYCDATFQLTSDCRIADKAPKLDSLLHLAPSAIGLQGRSFSEMIASARQREEFQADLRPDASPGGLLSGGAMLLDLNAAANTSVRVQLLCAPFEDVNGESRLLCGINEVQNDLGEYTEHTPLPKLLPNGKKHRMPRNDEMPRASSSLGRGTPARQPRSYDLSESGSESGVSSEGSGPAPSMSGKRVDVTASNVTAEVELTDGDARFLTRNNAFMYLMGLVENSTMATEHMCLSHLVRNPSGALATLRTLGCAGAPREATLSFDARCREALVEVQAVAVEASEASPTAAPRRVSLRMLSVTSQRRRGRRSAERGSLGESTPQVVGKPSDEHCKSL